MNKRCKAGIAMYIESIVWDTTSKQSTAYVPLYLKHHPLLSKYSQQPLVALMVAQTLRATWVGHLFTDPQWISQTHACDIFKIGMSNKRALQYIIVIAIINFIVVKILMVKIWQIHGHSPNLPNFPITKVSFYMICSKAFKIVQFPASQYIFCLKQFILLLKSFITREMDNLSLKIKFVCVTTTHSVATHLTEGYPSASQ